MPRIKEKYPRRKSRKKSKTETNEIEIHNNDSVKEITSSENEDSQNEEENNTIFNLTFKFDKKYMPPKDIIKKNELNRNLNFPIYRIILPELKKHVDDGKNLKNITFKDTIFLIDDIIEDGNCFYRAISNYICGTQKYHLFFRSLLFEYLTSNYNKIIEENPYTYYNDKPIKTRIIFL